MDENQEEGLCNNENMEETNVTHVTSVKLVGKGKRHDIPISEKR